MNHEIFKEAILQLERALSEDPRRVNFQGQDGPRDLLFSQKVVRWIFQVNGDPNETLLLAAWGHTIRRWKLPRGQYPKTTSGYHQWRRAQSALSADETVAILTASGCDSETIRRVRALILKTNFPQDPDSRTLEDADCLAFLEIKLEGYLKEWEEEGKILRILKGTLEKMTPKARSLAMKISYSPEAARLIQASL